MSQLFSLDLQAVGIHSQVGTLSRETKAEVHTIGRQLDGIFLRFLGQGRDHLFQFILKTAGRIGFGRNRHGSEFLSKLILKFLEFLVLFFEDMASACMPSSIAIIAAGEAPVISFPSSP